MQKIAGGGGGYWWGLPTYHARVVKAFKSRDLDHTSFVSGDLERRLELLGGAHK